MPTRGPVLTAHTLRPARFRYYVDDLVPGRAEVTGVAGESPGRWVGTAAGPLGLVGTVDSSRLGALLAGRAPTGAALRQARPAGPGRATREVGGFDLTYGAPKSVSVLALLGPDDVGRHVVAGHDAAVAASWQWLERAGLGVRRQVDGTTRLLGSTGFVAAEFLHRTSRALDPHVHTHLVVANVAHGTDGRWSTLDSRRLHAHLPATQALYHAHLRYELADRLGVAWESAGPGRSELAGVDPVLCGLFSQRSGELAGWIHEHGAPASARALAVAAAVTRPDKDRSATVDDLVDRWRERAADHGRDPRRLVEVVGRGVAPGRAPLPGTLDPALVEERLSERSEAGRVMGRRELVADLAASTPAGAPAPVVAGWAETATRVLGRGPGREQDPVGDRDGRWPVTTVTRVVGELAAGRFEDFGRLLADGRRSGREALERPALGPIAADGPVLVRAPDIELGR